MSISEQKRSSCTRCWPRPWTMAALPWGAEGEEGARGRARGRLIPRSRGLGVVVFDTGRHYGSTPFPPGTQTRCSYCSLTPTSSRPWARDEQWPSSPSVKRDCTSTLEFSRALTHPDPQWACPGPHWQPHLHAPRKAALDTAVEDRCVLAADQAALPSARIGMGVGRPSPHHSTVLKRWGPPPQAAGVV